MKNTINTNKYSFAKSVIAVLVFLIASPFYASAQLSGTDLYGTDTYGTDLYGSDGGWSSEPGWDTEPGYTSEPGWDYEPGYDVEPGWDYEPGYDVEPGWDYNPGNGGSGTWDETITTTETTFETYGQSYYGGGYYGGGYYTEPSSFYGRATQYPIYYVTLPSPIVTAPTFVSATPTPIIYAVYNPPASTVSSGSFVYPVTYTQPLQSTYVPNQVLAYTDTNNPELSAVYLSNLPATGAGDVVRVTLFALTLIAWSLLATYYLLRRKAKMQFAEIVSNEPVKVTDENKSTMLIGSDTSDMESLENYARENKVLLSTDAVKKLVKLERLNKADSFRLIKKMSKNEWLAVGEGDLEKYL
jgi:hypothetical protein